MKEAPEDDYLYQSASIENKFVMLSWDSFSFSLKILLNDSYAAY